MLIIIFGITTSLRDYLYQKKQRNFYKDIRYYSGSTKCKDFFKITQKKFNNFI